ncbi:MAG: TonB family protein [Gammaproteobacteria bacterium]|nr:TonB family protein [Gammaproteobacteria bacterium]
MNGRFAIRLVVLGLVAAFTTAASADASNDPPEPVEEADADPLTDDAYTPPQFKKRSAPFYPRRQAKHRRIGRVELDFRVDVDGKARDITVAASEGGVTFEFASVKALRRSIFEPARLDEQPVEAELTAVCEFGFEEADLITNYTPPGARQRVGSPSSELRVRRNFERADTRPRSQPPRLTAGNRKPSGWVYFADCSLK